ncbi:MAG: alpha/beta fold hydrolase [Polyangiales bacterium]
MLGPFSIARGGVALELPQSRKARALLALLASSGREHRRQQLCEWLWPDVDDPRGALRGALTRVRSVVDDAQRTRLCADPHAVRLDLDDVDVDVHALASTGELRSWSLDQLLTAAAACRGVFLEDLELPDLLQFQAYCLAEREQLGRRHRALLDELIVRHRVDPARALVYTRVRAQLDPSDQGVQARLIEQLIAAGRGKEADEHLRMLREWLERRGEMPSAALLAVRANLHAATVGDQGALAPVPPGPPPKAAPALQQQIRFCATPDGAKIAYALSGSGPPLLKAANWLNHLELDWESPVWTHWLRELSRDHTLIRYDERGNGLSDRDVPELSLDVFVEDLETVAAAAGIRRYALLGISQGCPVAMTHALRYPERVSHLILFNGFARGWSVRDAQQREEGYALMTLARHGWGRDQPAFRQVFTSMFFPEAPSAYMNAFNELQRHTSTPAQAVRMLEAIGQLDASHLMGQLKTPTLVLSSRHDGLIPFEEGRLMAAGIPNARFVTLESHNHLLQPEEPAFARFLEELRAFLATPGGPLP